MSTAPIGILDSGLGGLTVAREIAAQHPAESLIYVADTANAPYGQKSQAEIYAAVVDDVAWLIEQQCKLIVLACNSATISVIAPLRDWFPDVPIVGVVPMIKPAAAHTKTGTVAVFATKTTLASAHYAALKAEFAAGVAVLDRPAPDWVKMVDSGNVDAEKIARDVQAVVTAGADVIVLGCTHFPFLRPAIESSAGDVPVLDSSAAVARQVGRILQQKKARAAGSAKPTLYVATGEAEIISQSATYWLGHPIEFRAGETGS